MSHQNTISLVPTNNWSWVHSMQNSIIIMRPHCTASVAGRTRKGKSRSTPDIITSSASARNDLHSLPDTLSFPGRKTQKESDHIDSTGSTSLPLPSPCTILRLGQLFSSQYSKNAQGESVLTSCTAVTTASPLHSCAHMTAVTHRRGGCSLQGRLQIHGPPRKPF